MCLDSGRLGERRIHGDHRGSWSRWKRPSYNLPNKSKSQDTLHEGYMFPLLVKKQLENWPEKNFRKRTWVRERE